MSKAIECDICGTSATMHKGKRPAHFGRIELANIEIADISDKVLDICARCVARAVEAWGHKAEL